MVYPGHRSSGCIRCIKRKVKCDEKKPGCERCRKRKEECPGYARERFKFVTESEKQNHRLSVSEQLSDVSTDSSRSATSSPDFLNSSMMTRAWDEESVCWYFKNYVIPANEKGGPGWMTFLPQMYSEAAEGACVRWAVRAASLAAFANSTGLTYLAADARRIYGNTLMGLNLDLNNEKKARKDDSMVAILMLIIFEVITSERNPINNHIEGLLALMQLRGPEEFLSLRSRSVFRVVHMHVQMSCFAQKRRYTSSVLETELNARRLMVNPDDHTTEKFLLFYQANEFCAKATELMLDADQNEDSKIKLTNLMREATITDHLLEEWADKIEPSLRPRECKRNEATLTTYRTTQGPAAWNSYRYVRIILHETLLRAAILLGIENWTSEAMFTTRIITDSLKSINAIQTLASEICASIPFSLGDINSSGKPMTNKNQDGRAASCYLLMMPLLAVRLAHFTAEAQRKQASSALERIAREFGIKQGYYMLRARETPFEM